MKRTDKELGMDRAISRRDFINGASALAVAAAACPVSSARASGTSSKAYPPASSGLRGSHAGSFETMHDLAWEGRMDFGPTNEDDSTLYDLIIVGAGVSGLSAAHFFLKEKPDARILILENHDDFGGHAKRNEFQIDGRLVLGHGGSQTIDTPSSFSSEASGLLEELRIDLEEFETAYDQGFYKRHDLAGAYYFDQARFGEDRLVKQDFFGDDGGYIPLANGAKGASAIEALANMPIAAEAKSQVERLYTTDVDLLPDHSIFSEPSYLNSISYEQLLKQHFGVTHPDALALFRDMMTPLFAHGADATPALPLLAFLPGLNATSLGSLSWLLPAVRLWGTDPYIHHFPDGNASVARLLVRRLMPHVADGDSMFDIVLSQFDYSALDRTDAQVRLRLNSTVINVEHVGDAVTADNVAVTYVQNGESKRVRSKRAILACYNMAIPHLCPTLPEEQRIAQSKLVKMPLVYSNVAFNNWHAWKKAGVGLVQSPGRWHKFAILDFPVSLGDYTYAQSPDDPIVAHMVHCPTTPGATADDQSRAGRYQLLATSFEDYERELRDHLAGMLGAYGFDPATDIAGITVNRWSHGYSWAPNPLDHPDYDDGDAPFDHGRKQFGRISIANSDASGQAYLDAAIDEGYRAAMEQAAG